jgi:hypothetical protein
MKKIVLTLVVLGLATVLFSSCKKICYCTVQKDDVTLAGYDNLAVGEMTEDDCTAYSDTTWTSLGYTYTCVSE